MAKCGTSTSSGKVSALTRLRASGGGPTRNVIEMLQHSLAARAGFGIVGRIEQTMRAEFNIATHRNNGWKRPYQGLIWEIPDQFY